MNRSVFWGLCILLLAGSRRGAAQASEASHAAEASKTADAPNTAQAHQAAQAPKRQPTQTQDQAFSVLDAAMSWLGFSSMASKRSTHFLPSESPEGLVWELDARSGKATQLSRQTGFRWPISCVESGKPRFYAVKDNQLWRIVPGDPEARPVAPAPSNIAGMLKCRDDGVALLAKSGEVHLISLREQPSRVVGSVPVADIPSLLDVARTCKGQTLSEFAGGGRVDIVVSSDDRLRPLTASLSTQKHWDPSFLAAGSDLGADREHFDCDHVLFVAPQLPSEDPRPPGQLPPPHGCSCRFARASGRVWGAASIYALGGLAGSIRRASRRRSMAAKRPGN